MISPVNNSPRRAVPFTYDMGGRDNIDSVTLVGSWDRQGRYRKKWDHSAVPMQRDAKGAWHATVQLTDDKPHDWRWGVRVDGPSGTQQWGIFENQALKFSPTAQPSYAPTTLHSMGAVRNGADASFAYWAPHARNVSVHLWRDDPSRATVVPMQRDDGGHWRTTMPNGWEQWQGACYAYHVVRQEGDEVLRSDPYGRYRMGQQRGLAEVLLDPATGQETKPYNPESGAPPAVRFIRFELQGHGDADSAYLRLSDEQGRPMDKQALLSRLGPGQGDLVRHYHGDQFSDHWTDNADDSGRISLVSQSGAWAAMVNNAEQLAGLRYTLEVWKDGKLLGDTNGDGVLSREEAKRTAWNDPFDNQILPQYGWDRYNVLQQSSYVWKHDAAPRTAALDSQMVCYELHVGSFLGAGGNVRRSTFQDVVDRLGYLKELGINTLEVMPVNAYEGARDWGYVGTNSLGTAEQYGFEDKDGSWVSGADALKRLIDEAHGQGFKVVNDVVYNHWGLRYNDMWETDSKQNPYFDWGGNADGPHLKPQRYGPLPAYNNGNVRQFIVDSAVQQLDEFHFDGLRVDAAELLHMPVLGGGKAGWSLLQKMNRTIHFLHPRAQMTAEQFPNMPSMTHAAERGGGGFDAMWNAEFQHLLVNGAFAVGGLLERASRQQRTPMGLFLSWIHHHPFFDKADQGVTIITDHDETGNRERTVNVAMQGKSDAIPTQWARNACRVTFGVGMLSPGMPLLFSGEESLAQNTFRWGLPSTWDLGWDWLSAGRGLDFDKVAFTDDKRRHLDRLARSGAGSHPSLNHIDRQLTEYLETYAGGRREAERNLIRRCHYNFCKDVTALRNAHPALQADAELMPVHADDARSVMAFRRRKGSDEFLVIGSLNHEALPDYHLPVKGKWELVLNSDAARYGGDGLGVEPLVRGQRFNIPKAGLLVYRRAT